ncbi:uncharacterized protein LOC124892476 [Capsicum annuum]|uniref:uncharacterized protein LOC124892476 n=1 Tax=Capsicum annuum TaxID=4072 RepID=UPI001FB088F7|nr:uncharacterized protein LOC124892476 [Capsicum annuum]
MSIKLVIGGSTLNVISSYAPQEGLDDEEKKSYWEVLDEVVRGISSTEKLVVGGDFNGHVGSLSEVYNDVHDCFGLEKQNVEGVSLLDFARAFGLWVANSSFSKKGTPYYL